MGQRKTGVERDETAKERGKERDRWGRERQGAGLFAASARKRLRRGDSKRFWRWLLYVFYTFFCSFLYGALCPRSC